MKAVRKIVFIVSVIIFLGSCGILMKLLILDPYIADKSNSDARNIYYEDYVPQNAESSGRFDELIKINQDIRGWINIPNTVIDYPVMQAQNSEFDFYLTHNFQRSYSRYGAIFIDSSCVLGVDSKNVILHGHHMRDGKMFADLLKFSDLEFYKSSPVITFDTIKGDNKFKIISVFKTNTRSEQGEIFNYIIPEFKDKAKFLEYVYDVRIRSLIDIPVDVSEDDQILTLSTCSYEFDDFRTVIVARKLRDGESGEVDVSQAELSSDSLMPECWYKRYGGTRPVYPKFREAVENGDVKWYLPKNDD